MVRALPLILLLTACDPGLPPPDPALAANARDRGPAQLIPLDAILSEGTRSSRAAAAQLTLQARTARLTGARIPAPAGDDLEARGRRLRDRAAALRAAQI